VIEGKLCRVAAQVRVITCDGSHVELKHFIQDDVWNSLFDTVLLNQDEIVLVVEYDKRTNFFMGISPEHGIFFSTMEGFEVID
jgi:hypothetical protein